MYLRKSPSRSSILAPLARSTYPVRACRRIERPAQRTIARRGRLPVGQRRRGRRTYRTTESRLDRRDSLCCPAIGIHSRLELLGLRIPFYRTQAGRHLPHGARQHCPKDRGKPAYRAADLGATQTAQAGGHRAARAAWRRAVRLPGPRGAEGRYMRTQLCPLSQKGPEASPRSGGGRRMQKRIDNRRGIGDNWQAWQGGQRQL